MRVVIEKHCDGCTDGRVSVAGEPSHECPRCNGTSIERDSINMREFIEPLIKRIEALEMRAHREMEERYLRQLEMYEATGAHQAGLNQRFENMSARAAGMQQRMQDLQGQAQQQQTANQGLIDSLRKRFG